MYILNKIYIYIKYTYALNIFVLIEHLQHCSYLINHKSFKVQFTLLITLAILCSMQEDNSLRSSMRS